MRSPYLSVIIPAYNEEKIISNTIDEVYSFLKENNLNSEIIIGDDGSSDRTVLIVKKKIKQYKNIKLVEGKINKGKGAILRKCFSVAKGDIQLFIDSDLTIDINLIPIAIKYIEDGYDISIASKYLPNSNISYPLSRKIFSKGFAFITRILLNTKIRDHQCGLKCFRKEAIKKIMPHLKINGFLIDTEMLVIAQNKNFRIKEFPATVKPEYSRGSKVKIFKDSLIMGKGILRLRKRFKK